MGILFTLAWFLFAYRGFDRRDDIAGNVACVFALGVALFPSNGTPYERVVHFGSATLLFLALAYFSLFLFTKSSGSKTREKRIRNGIYKACGWCMLACIVAIGVYDWLLQPAFATLKPVFVLETLALWAFGFSWFIKGETLWKDAAS